MRAFYLIGFAILLTFDTLAQVGFKLGAMHTAPPAFELAWFLKVLGEGWVYCAVAGYIGSFITYMTLLKKAPIGAAFAATHFEIVTVGIVSYLFLGEKLSSMQILGGLLIMVGIGFLASEEEQDQDKDHDPDRRSTEKKIPERTLVDVA